jgi:hypothetical protein
MLHLICHVVVNTESLGLGWTNTKWGYSILYIVYCILQQRRLWDPAYSEKKSSRKHKARAVMCNYQIGSFYKNVNVTKSLSICPTEAHDCKNNRSINLLGLWIFNSVHSCMKLQLTRHSDLILQVKIIIVLLRKPKYCTFLPGTTSAEAWKTGKLQKKVKLTKLCCNDFFAFT